MPAANRPMGFNHPGTASLRTRPNQSGFETLVWLEIPDFRAAQAVRPIAHPRNPVVISPSPLPEPTAEPVATDPPSAQVAAPLEPRLPVEEALASVKPKISPVALLSAVAITGVLLVLLLLRGGKSDLGQESAAKGMAESSEKLPPFNMKPSTLETPNFPPSSFGAFEAPRLAGDTGPAESARAQWPAPESTGPQLSREEQAPADPSLGWPAPAAPSASGQLENDTEPFPRPRPNTADPLYEARLRGPAADARPPAEFEGTIVKPRGEWR